MSKIRVERLGHGEGRLQRPSGRDCEGRRWRGRSTELGEVNGGEGRGERVRGVGVSLG